MSWLQLVVQRCYPLPMSSFCCSRRVPAPWAPLPRSRVGPMYAKGKGKGSTASPKGLSKGVSKGGSSGEKCEILVVGAGCTGALVAALLPLEARRRKATKPRVALWEWGRGPAGRMTSFWTEKPGGRVVADVGAQVISMEDPSRLPSWMEDEVMVAENLSATEERRRDWYHFYAANGLPSLQRASLAQADLAELHFNRRVMSMSYEGNSWWASYSERGTPRSANWRDFELVIFAGTAADAMNLAGLREALAPKQLQALRGVRYDHRLAVALILKAPLAARVEELCEGRAEMVVEDSPIHLIARQDVKGRSNENAFAVVLHSTPSFAASNLQLAKQRNRRPKDSGYAALLSDLAELLKMQVEQLEKEVIDSKVVHWRQCQVQKPAQQDDSACAMLVDPMLILAGDYLAKDSAGSFQGCLDSAEAAAAMACDLLYGPVPEALPLRRWGRGDSSVSAPKSSTQRWRAKEP